MLFLKMQCKQHCLNPTLPPLNPTLLTFAPGNLPTSSQNVGFSSTKTHALSSVYTDTYDDDDDDDDAVLYCFWHGTPERLERP